MNCCHCGHHSATDDNLKLTTLLPFPLPSPWCQRKLVDFKQRLPRKHDGYSKWKIHWIDGILKYIYIYISISIYIYIYIYIYINMYTRKPGRSPTRQYGVLRPFLTCAPSLVFFWCFKKIFLLATQNQPNPGHQGEKRWMGSLYTFLWNKPHDTLSKLWAPKKVLDNDAALQLPKLGLFSFLKKQQNDQHYSFASEYPWWPRIDSQLCCLHRGYITCLGMCKVCTEAVHCVTL